MNAGQPHIFIVDDEAAAREMVGDYLKMHGFDVTLCDGGVSLRRAMVDHVPDLVVLDLNMPEEDGLSIVRDLKVRNSVPIIMLTATASPIDRIVGLELGRRRLHPEALRAARTRRADPVRPAARRSRGCGAGRGGSHKVDPHGDEMVRS